MKPIGARRLLTNQVAEAIRLGILSGRLTAGDRLVEAALATTLGVSRAPVRDALKLLRAEGLVAEEPGRGAIVTRSHASQEEPRSGAPAGQDLDELLDSVAGALASGGCEVVRLEVDDPPPIDLQAALSSALAEPSGSRPLRELAKGRRRAVIITSDATRATPTPAIVGPVVAELARGGIPEEAIDVVIGGGVHRPATHAEVSLLLGDEWAARLRVTSHDALAPDLVEMGCTSRGTRVLVNRLVAEADLRIAFGQVEPHEFAGFTGGRKAILPAVAGYETIVSNHSLEMLRSPMARPGVAKGNPIHEEMVAAARLAGLHFIVNVALDRKLRPIAVAAGNPEAAHEDLVSFLRGHFQVRVPERSPSVIVTGPGRPLDVNLYQSVKALVGIEPLLEADYGDARRPVVVLLSRCWDGAGSVEMFEPFEGTRPRRGCPAGGQASVDAESIADAAVASLECSYTIEMDDSYFIARVTPKCLRVIAWCPGVPLDGLAAFGWESAPDPVSAVEQALRVAREQEAAGRRIDKPLLAAVCPRAQRVLFAAPDGRTA